MDIPETVYSMHIAFQLFQIHPSPDLAYGFGVRRLDSDFKLDQAGSHLFQQNQFLLIQKVSRYLKVKVRHPVIMLQDELPNLHRVALPAVKGSVHEFHLRDTLFQKKRQFLLYHVQIAETHGFVD